MYLYVCVVVARLKASAVSRLQSVTAQHALMEFAAWLLYNVCSVFALTVVNIMPCCCCHSVKLLEMKQGD